MSVEIADQESEQAAESFGWFVVQDIAVSIIIILIFGVVIELLIVHLFLRFLGLIIFH